MPVLLLVLLGLVGGVAVEGVVSSYSHDESFWPWSRCRACGTTVPLRALAPLAGAILYPRCATCARTRWAHALQVEVATALAFVVLGLQYWGQPTLVVVSLAEAALLVAVLFIDLELRLIPTLLIVALVLLALLSAAAWPGLGLWRALLGGAIGFGTFGLLVVLARLVFGDGALGMGDANLALAIGCITGYPVVALALSLGVFLGGLGATVVLLAGVGLRRLRHDAGSRWGLRSTIPYGPYLVLGVLYVLAHGNTM